MGAQALTLQFGPLANYAGAFMWTMQRVLYETAAGSELSDTVTYIQNDDGSFTPRALLVDRPERLSLARQPPAHSAAPGEELFNNAPPSASDNDDSTDSQNAAWDGHIAVYRRAHAADGEAGSSTVDAGEWAQHCEQTFDENINLQPLRVVERWSGAARSNGEATLVADGLASLAPPAELEELEERVRRLAERSDRLDAFHLIVDGASSFCGVAAQAVVQLRDSYRGVCSLLFSLSALPGGGGARRSVDEALLANEAWLVATTTSAEDADAQFFPLRVDRPAPTAAAMMALGLEMATLPLRLSAADTGGHRAWSTMLSALRPRPMCRVSSLCVAQPPVTALPWNAASFSSLSPLTSPKSWSNPPSVLITRGLPAATLARLDDERPADVFARAALRSSTAFALTVPDGYPAEALHLLNLRTTAAAASASGAPLAASSADWRECILAARLDSDAAACAQALGSLSTAMKRKALRIGREDVEALTLVEASDALAAMADDYLE